MSIVVGGNGEYDHFRTYNGNSQLPHEAIWTCSCFILSSLKMQLITVFSFPTTCSVLKLLCCIAWEQHKGETLLELNPVNSTSKVILYNGGGNWCHISWGSFSHVRKDTFVYICNLVEANLNPWVPHDLATSWVELCPLRNKSLLLFVN